MRKFLYSIALLIAVLPFTAGQARADCGTPSAVTGSVIYNTTEKVFQYCSDTVWVGMNAPGTGAGGCAAPTLSEGQMVFNTDGRVLQGCAGSTHRAFGPPNGAEWVKISASVNHACGVLNNGKIYCWGQNGNGQLGDGTTNAAVIPVAVTGNDFWIDVAAGWNHTCGIKSDGKLLCWGERYGGKIGSGAGTGDQLTPVEVTGGGIWTQVSAGEDTSCGIKSNGRAYCWGARDYGRIGDGGATTGAQLTPILVAGGGTWKKISTDQTHTCGLKMDNSAWCWGSGEYRKTGRPTNPTTDTNTPINIFGGANSWLDIDAGNGHTCGIRSDGSARCWGLNDEGQLGIGSTTNSGANASPEVTGGGIWLKIDAGYKQSCAIRNDGTLSCWGQNQEGEVGDGTQLRRTSPVAVSGGGTWKQVSGGNYYTCGIRENGTRHCWGVNDPTALLGDGITAYAEQPVEIVGGGVWKNVSLWGDFACGIRSDDSLLCWGNNDEGELGNNGSAATQVAPVAVNGGGSWASLSMGYYHGCGIRPGGALYCWGLNTSRQIGDGTSDALKLVPTAVANGGVWSQISAGWQHSCGLKNDQTLWCWGDNDNGQLGDGSVATRSVPTAISGAATWLQVSAGETHSCGVRTDNKLYCWGLNTDGQLGDGTTTPQQSPLLIDAASDWKQVSTGRRQSCGIKADDTLWCWGYNGFGGLGDNTITARSVPTQVFGGGAWKYISVGSIHACAIKTDDTLWCWGYNGDGQAGYPGGTQRVPTEVSGGGLWSTVAAGNAHSCGVTHNSGHLYCWGSNVHGALTNTEFAVGKRLSPEVPVCLSPKGKPGALVYDSTRNQLQYCDGAGWVSIAGNAPAAPPVAPNCPSIGDICHDGTIYAGLHPQTGVRIYVAASDISGLPRRWSGTAIIDTEQANCPFLAVRRLINGQARWSDFGQPGCHDGRAYTAYQAGLANAAAPYAAAQACADLTAHGKTDWYLPAIDELETVYNNLKQGQPAGTYGFENAYYWSSSEEDISNAWLMGFTDGYIHVDDKGSVYLRVRCMR